MHLVPLEWLLPQLRSIPWRYYLDGDMNLWRSITSACFGLDTNIMTNLNQSTGVGLACMLGIVKVN